MTDKAEWFCPYCEKPLPDERAACCGEVGHGVPQSSSAGAEEECAAELLADDKLLMAAIKLYVTEAGPTDGCWAKISRLRKIQYLKRVQASPGEPSVKRRVTDVDIADVMAHWLTANGNDYQRVMHRTTVKALEELKAWRASGEPSGDYEWMRQNPDECASAVADAYENWEPGDPERGNWAECLAHEIEHQKSRLARFARGSKP